MSVNIPNRRIYIQDVINRDGAIDAERLLDVVNLFMEAVYIGFDSGIDFNENVNAQIIELKLNTPNDYVANTNFNPVEFSINIKGKKVQGVILARLQKTGEITKAFIDPVTISWVESKDKIKINYVSGLEDDSAYSMNVMVI